MPNEPDLARLILDAKGDRSYERMSADCGGLPTDKRLQQMATTPLKAFPDVQTIRGLARGTGATETAVVLAAARSLGLRVHAGDDPDALIIGGAGDLRQDQVEAVRALVRVFREMNAEAELATILTALDASEQRLAVGLQLLKSVPTDGPNRVKERAIMARNAIQALDELETTVARTTVNRLPAPVAKRLEDQMRAWNHLVHDLVEKSAKYPPFSGDTDLVTVENLDRLLGSQASGADVVVLKAGGKLRIADLRGDGTQMDEEPYPGPHDDDDQVDWAASHSPEPAGLPQPEEP